MNNRHFFLMKSKLLLHAVVFGVALLVFGPAAFADSITANFDIAIDGSIVTSQGQLTLTLLPDGSILGQFAVNPAITGEYYINMDMNVVAPTTLSSLTITDLGPPTPSYPDTPCLVTLTGVAGCPLVIAAGPGGTPSGDEFGIFSFQLDSGNGEQLTNFDFSVTQPGGFTSVNSLVALSGGGSVCAPSFPFYQQEPACGNVDFQLFSSGNIVGALAVPNAPSTTPVPEPGTLFMVGSGLLGLAGALRRKCLA